MTSTALPDLRKLRHALALADTGNFARASRQLHLSQPALTRSIQALESQLGMALFDRQPCGVLPTPQGAALLLHARQLLQQANGLLWEATLLREGATGSVNVGIGPMLTPALPPAIAAVQHAHPRLKLRVEIKPAWQLVELLLDEQLEFCVGAMSQLLPNPQLDAELLVSLPVSYFARPDHPLSRHAVLHSSALADYPLATSGYHGALRSEPAQLTPASASARGLLSCEDLYTLKWAALHGDAVLLASAWALQPELAAGQLVAVRFSDAPAEWQADVHLVHLAGRSFSPAARVVIAQIRDQLQMPGRH